MSTTLDRASRTTSLRICLAGNPNTGKTSVFNALTGMRQWVGNYSGVTVEKAEGYYFDQGRRVDVVDLPGIFSLTAEAPDERIARGFLTGRPPDLIVNVVDASNLRRNLYLTVQLIETGLPVLLVLNMTDIADRTGISIDADKISAALGVDVIGVSAGSGAGMDALRGAISKSAGRSFRPSTVVTEAFDAAVVGAINDLERTLGPGEVRDAGDSGTRCVSARWMAIRLLEGDSEVRDFVLKAFPDALDILRRADCAAGDVQGTFGQPAEVVLAEMRRGFVDMVYRKSVRGGGARFAASDRIDSVLMNRWAAIPAFFAMMYGVFWLAFEAVNPAVEATESLVGLFAEQVASFWPAGSESILRDLLVDGAIAGVGAVVVFLPNILVLYLAIAVLESTGYMARVAFILDGCMRRLGGLEGSCTVPLVLGFGCTVPAIFATRAIKSPRDRLLTMLVAPLMSCGARLPVYTLLAGAFFPSSHRALAVWGIYAVGIGLALACSKLLGLAVQRPRAEPSISELPPYHLPKPQNVLAQTWHRSWHFVRKAGTLILAASILMWAACTFPVDSRTAALYAAKIVEVENSSVAQTEREERIASIEARKQGALFDGTLAGRLGAALEPVVRPLGFDRRIAVSFIGAAAAKELFVSQISVAYAGETSGADSDKGIESVLRNKYTPLQGFCVMLFCLIAMPCIATFAAVKQESNSWKWPIVQWVGLTCLGYLVTLVVYQIGSRMA